MQACEVERPRLDAALRTDMDQVITSKEHVTGKIRGKCRDQLCILVKIFDLN